MAVDTLIVHAVGVPYLAAAADLSPGEAVADGLIPFLIGDTLKAALAMGLLPAAWNFIGIRD